MKDKNLFPLIGVLLVLMGIGIILWSIQHDQRNKGSDRIRHIVGEFRPLPKWFPAPDYKPSQTLEETLQQIRQNPKDSRLYLDLVALYAQRGQWDKTLEASRRLAEMAPLDPNAPMGVAYAYVHLGQPSKALQAIEKGLRLPMAEEQKAYLYRVQGDLFLLFYEQKKEGKYLTQAETAYRTAVAKNPGVALAFIGLARVDLLQDKWQSAKGKVQMAEKVRRIPREAALSYYFYGVIAERQGDLEAAGSWYGKALVTHPNSFSWKYAELAIGLLMAIPLGAFQISDQALDYLVAQDYSKVTPLFTTRDRASRFWADWDSVTRSAGPLKKWWGAEKKVSRRQEMDAEVVKLEVILEFAKSRREAVITLIRHGNQPWRIEAIEIR